MAPTQPEADRLFHVLDALTVSDRDSDAYGRVVTQVSHALDNFDARHFDAYGACMSKAYYESGDMGNKRNRRKVEDLIGAIEEAIHNDPRNVPDAEGV